MFNLTNFKYFIFIIYVIQITLRFTLQNIRSSTIPNLNNNNNENENVATKLISLLTSINYIRW